MSKVMTILVLCDSTDLGGIVGDFFKQFQNSNINEIKADYVKPLVVSDTMTKALKKARNTSFKTKEIILNCIKKNDSVGYADMIKLDIPPSSIANTLKNMIDSGEIKRIGDKPYRYEIVNTEEENDN